MKGQTLPNTWRPGDFASKADANQPEIVKALRKLGWRVKVTHRVGQGFPDTIAAKRCFNILIEIKNPARSPKQIKLGDDQRLFHDAWPGPICVVKDIEEVIALNDYFDELYKKIGPVLEQFKSDIHDPEYF